MSLLSAVGAKTYALLKSLLAPDLPKSKSYEDLSKMLKAHYEPKPLIIAERFHIYRRSQVLGESVADFAADLRCLSIHCESRQIGLMKLKGTDLCVVCAMRLCKSNC